MSLRPVGPHWDEKQCETVKITGTWMGTRTGTGRGTFTLNPFQFQRAVRQNIIVAVAVPWKMTLFLIPYWFVY